MEKMTESLTWEAVYDKGFSYWECSPEGFIIGVYEQIDRSVLVEFRLYRTSQLLNFYRVKQTEPELKMIEPMVVVKLKKGYSLLWR